MNEAGRKAKRPKGEHDLCQRVDKEVFARVNLFFAFLKCLFYRVLDTLLSWCVLRFQVIFEFLKHSDDLMRRIGT